MSKRLVPCGLLICLLFVTSSWIQGQEAPEEEGRQGQELARRPEVPDDPPGEPARPSPGAPPAARIRYGRFVSVQVNVDQNGSNVWGDAANEPSIAVDPTNPLVMAIGWRQFDTVGSNFRQAGRAYTTDGGRTWTFPGVLEPDNFRSDPVLSFDAEGSFYYCSLEGNGTTDVFTSTDGGLTWGPPVFSWGGDKQWLGVDRTEGIGKGNLYSFWSGDSNTFTRSVDGGQSFEPPTSIPEDPRLGTMDVGPDGTLYVGGSDAFDSPMTFFVSESENAQDPSMSPTFTTQVVDMGGVISLGGGPNPVGLSGQVWIAVDRSDGSTSGNIYVLCSTRPFGVDPLDVHFIRSTDGGFTWSSPIRVNDDSSDDAWQWFATMSVAPNGRIDAVWNDTRNSGTVNLSELYYSFSEDGGLTWAENQKMSPMWDSFIGWPQQQKIGDYYDMISDRVGADLAWAATFNGEQDVYYLRIGDYDCNQNGIGDSTDIAQGNSFDDNGNGIPDECEASSSVPAPVALNQSAMSNFPNPFSSSTTIHFQLTEGSGPVQLEIYNAEGRLVRTLLDGPASPGTNSAGWDGRDDQGRPVSPGLYFYRLEGGDLVQTGRALMLR